MKHLIKISAVLAILAAFVLAFFLGMAIWFLTNPTNCCGGH